MHSLFLLHHFLYRQPFGKKCFIIFPAQYCSDAAYNALGIAEYCLVFYELIPKTINQIFRIIVSISLRHIIFYLLHAPPAAGRMGNYKTLCRVRLRLFWPKIRSNIHRWIKNYPYYQLTFLLATSGSRTHVLLACEIILCYNSCRHLDA